MAPASGAGALPGDEASGFQALLSAGSPRPAQTEIGRMAPRPSQGEPTASAPARDSAFFRSAEAEGATLFDLVEDGLRLSDGQALPDKPAPGRQVDLSCGFCPDPVVAGEPGAPRAPMPVEPDAELEAVEAGDEMAAAAPLNPPAFTLQGEDTPRNTEGAPVLEDAAPAAPDAAVAGQVAASGDELGGVGAPGLQVTGAFGQKAVQDQPADVLKMPQAAAEKSSALNLRSDAGVQTPAGLEAGQADADSGIGSAASAQVAGQDAQRQAGAIEPGAPRPAGEQGLRQPPAEPRPAQAAIEAADEQAAFKRSAQSADQDPAQLAKQAIEKPGRGVSDAVLARAPGEQVRAAAKAAGSDTTPEPTRDAQSAKAAAPQAVTPNAAQPAQTAPTAPGLVFTPLASASAMTQAVPASPDLAPDAAVELDAEASLDPAGSRPDARAEVQRHSMPQTANAHAAARFQPHTVQTLAARIAARSVDGGRVFDIRLDPAELGGVKVRLEVGSDNSVRALLSAERPDTLAELQRSARDLERALAEAGLDLAEGGLSFSLNDPGSEAGREGERPSFTTAAWRDEPSVAADLPEHARPVRLYGFELAARRGLDLRT